MSKAQARGLREALAEAEALARVLRIMSDGKIGLQPVLTATPGMPPLAVSWGEALTEAAQLSVDRTPRSG